MAYVKPGVEITQTQVTVSPTLIDPDLPSIILGKSYHVEETGDYTYGTYDDTQTVIDLDAVGGTPTGAVVHDDSVYVDLIGGIGVNAGTRIHLVHTTDFTVAGNVVTLLVSLFTTYPTLAGTDATVEIGFRAQRTDLSGVYTFESNQDITDQIGPPMSYNPLGIGLSVSLQNTGTPVKGLPVNQTVVTEDSNDFIWTDVDTNALKAVEVYGISTMSDDASVDDGLVTHVNTYSAATEKRERIALYSPTIAWKKTDGAAATGPTDPLMDTTVTAGVIKANAIAQGEKRLVYLHPDTGYVTEVRHVSTLTTAYLDYVQGVTTLLPYLANTYSVIVSTVTYNYPAGTEVTATVLSNLATANTFLTVMVPVPGYVATAALSGMIAGQTPEQPFTNSTLAGTVKIKYSSDIFSQSDLNIIAEGGNMILEQLYDTSPVNIRHQLTTDVSSIETKELSIIKTIDYVSKFVRSGLTPYIGKYTINDQFLKMVNMILQAQRLYLVKNKHINDMKVLSLVQSVTSPDTIEVTLDVAVKYPVNYIKIELQF